MNKRKKLIAILSSAVVLVLVAYALFKPQKPYIAPADSDQMTATQAYEKSVITGSGAFGKISKEATPDINVSISNASYNSFSAYLDKISTKYSFSELFYVNEALNKVEKESHARIITHTHNALSADNTFNATTLYDLVIDNNAEFLKSSKAYMYSELDASIVEKACGIIVDSINSQIQNNPNIDKNEVACTLSELKIFYAPSPNFASFTPETTVLNISKNMMNVLERMRANEDEDTFKVVISHESNHIIQAACLDFQTEATLAVGISRKYDDLPVNSLNLSWFYDGTAEKIAIADEGTESIYYKSLVAYYESINNALILNANYQVDDLAKANYSKNINDLFKLFSCDSEQDKVEIINMLYAIEIVQFQPKDFIAAYSKAYSDGHELTDEEIVPIKRELKTSVCETLTKIFYKNLAKAVSDGKVKLADIFYLISVFEADINSHIDYINGYGKFEYNKKFMIKYIEIQDEFFESLASNNISAKDLTELFNNYGLKLSSSGNTISNYSLALLDETKRVYVQKLRNTLEKSGTENIRTSYAIIQRFKKTGTIK